MGAVLKVEDRKLLDSIVLLASLVSDVKRINPLLDSFRRVTAKINLGEDLADGDRVTLLRVKDSLEGYLVRQEPMRSFTPEVLHANVLKQLDGRNSFWNFSRASQSLFWVLGTTILSYLVAVIAFPGNISQRVLLGPILANAVFYIGIIWLIWSSLSSFSRHFRRAYLWICFGFLALGIGAALSPLVLAYPDLSNTVIFRYGVIMPIFTAGIILINQGTIKLASAVDPHLPGVRPGVVYGLMAALAAFAALVPHPTQEPSELYFRLVLGCELVAIVAAGYSAALLFKVALRTTRLYSRFFFWLGLSQAFLVISGTVATVILFAVGQISGALFTYVTVLFVIPAIMLLIAAYKFRVSSEGR